MMFPNDPRRQTGRTTRMLMNALEIASGGKKVVCIFHTTQMAEHARYMCEKILNDKFFSTTREIIFPNGGKIFFIGPMNIDYIMRGNRFAGIFVDHAYFEAGFKYDPYWNNSIGEDRPPKTIKKTLSRRFIEWFKL